MNRLVALLAFLLGACASPASPVPVGLPDKAHVDAPELAPAATGAPTATGEGEDAAAAGSTVAAAQQVLESTRSSARSTAEWLARGVDSWFGNRPFEDGGKVSDGRLSAGVFKRQDQHMDVDVRFNAHFQLPNARHRAYLFVGRDDPRTVVKDTPDAFSRQQRLLAERPPERSFLAGLGLSLRDAVDFRLGLGAGAKPYAQARYDEAWTPAPGDVIDFRETLFWTHDDRFGLTTALSLDHPVSATLAVRWLNAATITQRSRNFELSSSLGVYKLLGQQRLLSFEALYSGTGIHGTDASAGRSEPGLLAKWEQPIYKTWMFGEIVGGHFWPRPGTTRPRGRAWAAGGSLKMRF